MKTAIIPAYQPKPMAAQIRPQDTTPVVMAASVKPFKDGSVARVAFRAIMAGTIHAFETDASLLKQGLARRLKDGAYIALATRHKRSLGDLLAWAQATMAPGPVILAKPYQGAHNG